MQQERRTQQRSVLALALLVMIPLVFGVVVVDPVASASTDTRGLLFAAMIVVAGVVAAWVLGRAAWSDGLRRASARHYVLALVIGGLSFGAALLYVRLWSTLLDAPASDDEVLSALAYVSVLVLAPCLEEWLCRGVAWHAFERLSGPLSTLFGTAAIFAILHGLNGAYVLEFPHRFVAGLGFGLLRWHSGSVFPAVLAHFTLNALAVFT